MIAFLIDPEGTIVLVDGNARDISLFLEKQLKKRQ